jgi:fibronectin type 3 domain-containing protein
VTRTSYITPVLPTGHTYYFAVTAVDAAGNESAYSNEGSKQIQ